MLAKSLASTRHVFRHASFRTVWLGRLFSGTASLAQGVAIGWQVYDIARATHDVRESAFLVGMVGLVQFLPLLLTAPLAGDAVDRYDRKKIIVLANGLQIAAALGLTINALPAFQNMVCLFVLAALFGLARSFIRPAMAALAPTLVPLKLLPRAIAWNAISYQFSMIIGPWLAGLLCMHSVFLAYAFSTLFWGIGGLFYAHINVNTRPDKAPNASRSAMIREGFAYVWTNKPVLGAISLDLLAVLLGGATALLPVFAKDILHIGADGFGLLRSGTALGSTAVSIVLSIAPIERRTGLWMLGSTAVFGAATLVFAFSVHLWLSMGALIVLGAADAISVFVRQSFVQIVTPNVMRGRVAALSNVFISASNELGEFESGVAARFFGPIGSAAFGGLGAILVTLAWAKIFPSLRKTDRMIPTDPV